jgi:hypothetical protein
MAGSYIELIIGGQVIDFPQDSSAPDWAPAVIAFAQAVTAALGEVIGPYDVLPQQMIIDTIPNGSPTAVTNLSFSTTAVIAARIDYAVYRNSTSTTLSETGTMRVVYNATNSPGSLWLLSRESDGDAMVDFSISDTGQVSINPTAIGGTGYSGFVDYRAISFQVQY